MKRTGRRRRRGGTLSVSVIVLAFLAVMGVQIYRMKIKDDAYAAQQAELLQQYEDETQRAQDMDEWEAHMKSTEFTIEQANQMGLLKDNQIIFKEKDD